MKINQANHPNLRQKLLSNPTGLWLWTAAFLAATANITTAQTIRTVAQPTRITVPISTTISNGLPFTSTLAGVVSPVHLTIPTLPTGVTYSINTNDFTSSATGVLTLNTVNVPEGLYTFTLDASGGATNILLVDIQSAHVWSGADQTNSISPNWTSSGNWVGGLVPDASSDVVFNDSAALASGVTTTNVVIAANTEIASLRFAQTAGATRRHNIQINPGATLKVSGANGLWVLRDRTDGANPFNVFFTGINGALVVTNESAEIQMFTAINQASLFDMSALGSFTADVSKIGICDYRAYPHYTNLVGTTGNNYPSASQPRQMPPGIKLARTNYITANFPGDANNYADPAYRYYALMYGNNEAGGTGTRGNLYFGISNVFNLSSVCFHGAGTAGEQSANNVFNPSFIASNCIAIFRNTNGTRMPMFVIADGAGPGASGTGTKGQINFTGGTVDALVDRLYLARERTNSTGANVQALLTMSAGSFDANEVVLGYQGQGNNQGTGIANCQGTINVNTSAVFRVNGTLQMGYTTADPGHTTQAEAGFGQISMTGGGTVMASNILIGGVTKVSVNNNITMTSGSKLIVTNGIGQNVTGGKLNLLNMTDSSLTMTVDGNTPRIFVKTLTLNGLANAINVSSVANIGGNFPVRIPLISYESLSGSFILGTLPSQSPTLYGWLDVDTGNQTVDLIITTNAPNRLIWKGNISSSWNHTDKNWVTFPGGIQTNFNEGNLVQFDDTAVGSTDISVDETVLLAQLPGTSGMLVTNTSKNYRFSGFSSIGGSAQMVKQGNGSLTLEGSSALATLVTGGTLLGSGTIGSSVTMQNGTTFNFGGTINGGLSVSNTTAIVTGTVNGGLNLRAGSLANNGTIAGTITVATNVTFNNNLGAIINVTVPWSVPTNSTLINNGTINQNGSVGGNNGLTVTGTLKGVGTIVVPTGSSADARVTIGPGGTLMIGNTLNEITNVTIATRLDFISGSSTTFDVDNSGSVNDQIFLTAGFITGKVNFGNGNSLGGTFVLNRLSGPNFNQATSLHLFNLFGPGANIPDNASQALPGVVPPPAPGLTWDVSQMVTNLTLVVTAPPSMTNSISIGTNGVKNLVFEWPDTYRGWRLERQTNSLAVGLESPSTNWVSVANSFAGTNSLYYPDITNNPGAFWFRSSVAVTDTNGAALAPATFFKLTYP